MLSTWLSHPLTRGMDIDSPETTRLRKEIIRRKPFLRKIYEEWYQRIAAEVPAGPGGVLELGTGAGFLKDFLPGLITSDVFAVEGVDLIVDSANLPFEDGSLKAVVMTNVFHHFSDPRRFLDEATRCVRAGGRVIMLEPWNTRWARFIYRRLHHEPFEPAVADWSFDGSGPLSDANGALPWIVFQRDREQLLAEYPEWTIRSIRVTMPFRYLVSGGVSMRSLTPGWTFPLWRILEGCLWPFHRLLGMFALITLEKTVDHKKLC
jgi:SAM-dependent methyltransferase